jgi:hypothetical protein
MEDRGRKTNSLFVWLISHKPAVLFFQNKSATSKQPTILFSRNKSAPAINHQPNEQAARLQVSFRLQVYASFEVINALRFYAESAL